MRAVVARLVRTRMVVAAIEMTAAAAFVSLCVDIARVMYRLSSLHLPYVHIRVLSHRLD